LISFDDESGRYQARKPRTYFPVGEGDSLYSAVDDLEAKLAKKKNDQTIVQLLNTCSKCQKPIAPNERNYPLNKASKEGYEILCPTCFAKTLSITQIQTH
jgi:hypothetical protein